MLIPAATRGLILHLEKLESEAKVERTPSSDVDSAPMPGWNDGWRWGGEDDAEGKDANL